MFGDRIREHLAQSWTFSADGTKVLGRVDGACRVVGCDVFNSSNLATHGTNYLTLKLINMGTAASGTTVVASASTSQTGGSAMTANKAFPLTVVAAAQDLADGEALGIIYDEQTTDVADNHELRVVVRLQRVGPPASS